MGRSLKYEIPGTDPRVHLDEVAEKGWDRLFASRDADARRPRVLEIGFGRGEYLLAMAAKAPETEFVGIEVSFKRTLKMARKVARAGLANVRLLEARAQEALPLVFAPGSLDAIWINFSDPWPKTRHAHRRLVRAPFVAEAAKAIAPDGHLHIATDDVPYAHQIDALLAGEPSLVNAHAPWRFLSDAPGRMRTGYEEQWRAEGRPMHFFDYRRAFVDRRAFVEWRAAGASV